MTEEENLFDFMKRLMTESMFVEVMKSNGALERIAMRDDANPELLHWVAKNADSYEPHIFMRIIRNNSVDPRTIDLIYHKATSSYMKEASDVTSCILKSPKITTNILNQIEKGVKTLSHTASEILIENPKCPISLVNEIVHERGPYVMKHAAGRLDLTKELFDLFAGANRTQVDEKLAVNKATPSDILEIISKRHSKEVREATAAHPNASVQTLKRLWKNPEYRSTIVKNPNCPEALKDKYMIEQELA
jgi:hypothetical protein